MFDGNRINDGDGFAYNVAETNKLRNNIKVCCKFVIHLSLVGRLAGDDREMWNEIKRLYIIVIKYFMFV